MAAWVLKIPGEDGYAFLLIKANKKREKSGKCRLANLLASSRYVQFVGLPIVGEQTLYLSGLSSKSEGVFCEQ